MDKNGKIKVRKMAYKENYDMKKIKKNYKN